MPRLLGGLRDVVHVQCSAHSTAHAASSGRMVVSKGNHAYEVPSNAPSTKCTFGDGDCHSFGHSFEYPSPPTLPAQKTWPDGYEDVKSKGPGDNAGTGQKGNSTRTFWARRRTSLIQDNGSVMGRLAQADRRHQGHTLCLRSPGCLSARHRATRIGKPP